MCILNARMGNGWYVKCKQLNIYDQIVLLRIFGGENFVGLLLMRRKIPTHMSPKKKAHTAVV